MNRDKIDSRELKYNNYLPNYEHEGSSPQTLARTFLKNLSQNRTKGKNLYFLEPTVTQGPLFSCLQPGCSHQCKSPAVFM